MKVILADDHGILRDTLSLYIEREPDMELRTAASLDEAIDIVLSEGDFDIGVLDFHMPGMFGLESIETFKKKTGIGHVAIISGIEKRDVAQAAIDAGACGFLPKTLSAKSMVNAIRFMNFGETYLPLDFMTQQQDASSNPLSDILSRREQDVLRGLLESKSNKEIARDLDIQETTVKLHVKTLYRKLGASNRTHAAMIARDKNFS